MRFIGLAPLGRVPLYGTRPGTVTIDKLLVEL
jgi:hypothetical protein